MHFSNFSTTHFKSNRELKARAVKLNFHNCSDDQKTENKDKWGTIFFTFLQLFPFSAPPTPNNTHMLP